MTDHDSGGYNMDDSEIGVVLMSTSIFQFLWQVHVHVPKSMTLYTHYLIPHIEQIFVFPRIAKCLGYRYTFLFGVLLFGATSMIFPLSNKITGPIGDDVLSSLGSANGSISTSELDYCGNDLNGEDSSVNENSVVRVPARVWATLILINAVWIISRLAYIPVNKN